MLNEYNIQISKKLEDKLKLEDLNQLDKKIEEHEKFLIKENIEPKYASLTTVRGILKFPKLPPKMEKKYQYFIF